MNPDFEKIRQLSKPFLETRHNDVHTEVEFFSGPFTQ